MRIEIQIRHDNGATGYLDHNENTSKIYGFLHGFSSYQSRNDIFAMIKNHLDINNESSYLEAPWSIRRIMIDFTRDLAAYSPDEHLKYVPTIDLDQPRTRLLASEDGKHLFACVRRFIATSY